MPWTANHAEGTRTRRQLKELQELSAKVANQSLERRAMKAVLSARQIPWSRGRR